MESAEQFLQKMKTLVKFNHDSQILQVKSLQSPAVADVFQSFEKVYLHAVTQFYSGGITDKQLVDTYQYIYSGLKRLRRKAENLQKFNQTDYHAFVKKHKHLNIQFTSLIFDIKLDFSKKMQILKKEYEDLVNINFNHHHYTNKELCQASLQIFEILKVFEQFNVDKDQLSLLLIEINSHYNVLAYHNFTHAFALSQLLFCCHELSDFKLYVKPIELFAGLMAGLSHDINHKGVNNLYKLKKAKLLGRQITEQSILESMHAAEFFNILAQNPQLDFLESFKEAGQRNQFRRIFITSIIATDMGRHNKLAARFEQRVQATKKPSLTALNKFRSLSPDSHEDRKYLLNVFVHACDIANPTLEWDGYMKWSFMLSQEFQDQTIKEEAIGVDVTQMLKYKDRVTFFNGQSFFSKVLVFPLWKSIGVLFDQLMVLPNEIEINLKIIEREKDKCQKQ